MSAGRLTSRGGGIVNLVFIILIITFATIANQQEKGPLLGGIGMNREMYLNPKELKLFRTKQIIGKVLTYLFLTLMALYIFVPFY